MKDKLKVKLNEICRIIQSQCLGGLVTYFSKSNNDAEYSSDEQQMTYWYAAGLIFCTVIRSAYSNPFLLYAFQLGLQVRVTITSMIYRKVNRKYEILLLSYGIILHQIFSRFSK